ncbi:MAG: hydrolase, partial [Muribaculaceae bacterium]|nr:hydrolase [Muribaculaceae bacterium]
MKIPKQKNVVRLLFFIVATALIVYFLPRIDEHSYSYEVNRPWSYSLLTAPFDIPIHLDSIRAREVKDSIDEAFVPVYTRQVSVTNEIMESFRSGLTTVSGISSSERTMLERHLKTLLDDGIVDQNTYNLVVTGHMPYVRTLKSNVVQNQSTASYRSPRRAYAWLDSVMSSTGHHHAVEQTGLSKLMTANVVYDSVASRRILDDAYQKAMAPVGVVQQGERIIDRGDIITPQLYTVLRTYERMTAEKGRDNTSQNLYPLVGQTLYVILLLGCVYGFLFFFRRRLFNDFKVISFLLSMIVVFTIFGFIMSGAFTSGLYIVPFTMVPIMVVAFFDGRTALFCHLVTVLLCAVIASYPLEFIYIQFVGGVIAINSLKELSRRSQLLRTAVLVLIGYSLSYVAMEVMQSGSVTTLSTRMFGYFLINVVFVSFAYVLVFVFEKLFGFTSVVALVELSDINNPVLRELSEECPGTFQHSMSVRNLASEAAHQSGANVQLVRA